MCVCNLQLGPTLPLFTHCHPPKTGPYVASSRVESALWGWNQEPGSPLLSSWIFLGEFGFGYQNYAFCLKRTEKNGIGLIKASNRRRRKKKETKKKILLSPETLSNRNRKKIDHYFMSSFFLLFPLFLVFPSLPSTFLSPQSHLLYKAKGTRIILNKFVLFLLLLFFVTPSFPPTTCWLIITHLQLAAILLTVNNVGALYRWNCWISETFPAIYWHPRTRYKLKKQK